MDKSCINCKWYFNNKCNCKDCNINIVIENKIQDQIVEYIESGSLSENIQENLNFKELKEVFDNIYNNAGALKKNINNNKINAQLEENYNIIELIDECISSSLIRYFKNVNSSVNVKVSDPVNYYCKYWE